MPLGCLKALLTPICSKMLFLVVHPSAQLFQSAVNTLENTLRSNLNCKNCSHCYTPRGHKDNLWLSSIHYSSWKISFSQRLLPPAPTLNIISGRSNTPRTNNGVS